MINKRSKLSLFLRHGVAVTKNAVLPSTPARRKQSREQHCALIQAIFTLDPDNENLYHRKGNEFVSRPDEMTTRRHLGFGPNKWDHSIRFALGNGYLPDEGVDHDDTHRANNWLSNLRPADAKENNRNRKTPRKQNGDMPKGVCLKKTLKDGRIVGYYARATDENGVLKHLGYFSVAQLDGDHLAAIRAASAAYQEFAASLHGEFKKPPSLSQPAFRPQ
jgi:hypothetical protein